MSFSDEVEILIRARYPILYIITSEELRVEKILRQIAAGRQKRFSSGPAAPA